MAIVASGTASTGARWRIHDDAYINNTPEQNERIRLNACRIAYAALCRIYAEEQSERRTSHVPDDRSRKAEPEARPAGGY